MTFARLGQATHIAFHDLTPPFSNFQFVDSLLPDADYPAVRRLFSLARKDNQGKTVVLEDIEAEGAVADENAELSSLFPGYQCIGLKRLTFWSCPCAAASELEKLTDADLLGYAIIKQDCAPPETPRWHIFESVFRKYGHHHNCVPDETTLDVRCGQREFRLAGVMYCQQNGLNKACAQVALRSLLSRILPNRDICYSEMNNVARQFDASFKPSGGLSTFQIRAVLDQSGVKYDDIDYEVSGLTVPYSRILYAGIENGFGGLLGFELSDAGATGQKHIIPFYGHTFNQDSWVPRASLAYFHVGDNTRYISSEEWMGSFIGHDDNFGSNYCVPRRFLDSSQVKYVVALRPADTAYGAVLAEVIGVDFLYSTVNALRHDENYWVRRLILHIQFQDVVLRTLYMTGSDYVEHLRSCRDWNGHAEECEILDVFQKFLPEHLWMVEVSIPELFPTNYRKLGEMILDARVPLDPYPPQEPLWIVARFPGSYLIVENSTPGAATYLTRNSSLESHIPVYRGLDIKNGP